MSETIGAGKTGIGKASGTVSPEEMLRQAVGGRPTNTVPAAEAQSRRSPLRLDANGRLAVASVAALACGLTLGFLTARHDSAGTAFEPIRAELAAERAETTRLAGDVDRLARTMAGLRETSEAVRSEAKTLGTSLADRIGRAEQTLDRRLVALSETVAQGAREQNERLAQLDRKTQPVAAAPPTKADPKPEARTAEPTQTGSLQDKSKSETLDGWALRDVYDGIAVLEDRRRRLVEVGRGDAVPGVGRVEAIERRGRQWVVVTRQGLITPQTW